MGFADTAGKRLVQRHMQAGYWLPRVISKLRKKKSHLIMDIMKERYKHMQTIKVITTVGNNIRFIKYPARCTICHMKCKYSKAWVSVFDIDTVYPKKYAHGFVVLCFVVVMQSFIMNSHEVFIHIHQGCFADTGAIARLPQCQWSKPDGYGKNQSMYNHNKAQQSKNRVHISWDILYMFCAKVG